jgi:hypothetical protein
MKFVHKFVPVHCVPSGICTNKMVGQNSSISVKFMYNDLGQVEDNFWESKNVMGTIRGHEIAHFTS